MKGSAIAYESLRNDILEEKYVKGEHLSETVLAKKYDVSRLHIKAALQQLEREHIVEHFSQRGYFVRGLDEEDIIEINRLRKALTLTAIEPIIDTVSEEDIETLRRYARRIEVFVKGGLLPDTYEEVISFYNYLYSLTPYQRIANILRTYNGYIVYILRHEATTKADHEKGAAYILSLTEAIESRDIEKVREIIDRQDDIKAAV